MRDNLPLTLVEIVIIGGIVVAFLLPLVVSSNEVDQNNAIYVFTKPRV
jgi:hypothetical protein